MYRNLSILLLQHSMGFIKYLIYLKTQYINLSINKCNKIIMNYKLCLITLKLFKKCVKKIKKKQNSPKT